MEDEADRAIDVLAVLDGEIPMFAGVDYDAERVAVDGDVIGHDSLPALRRRNRAGPEPGFKGLGGADGGDAEAKEKQGKDFEFHGRGPGLGEGPTVGGN